MVLKLELTPEQEKRLTARTLAAGLNNPADYVIRYYIDADAPVPAGDLPKTPAEADAYWEREGVYGLFADGPDSPELARKLRAQAEARNGSE